MTKIITHCKKWFASVALIAAGSSAVNAQCTWADVSLESFEYTTVIPGLTPGTTFQNTPQTFPGCVHNGARGLYMNFVENASSVGLVYEKLYPNMCVGANYRVNFWTRDANGGSNDLTFQVVDAANNVIASQDVVNNGTWQNIIMPFNTPTTDVRFQIINNLMGSPAGNDAGFDELRLQICNPNPVNDTKTQCFTGATFNLFDELSNVSQTGTWTGPSTVTNGYQGTFTEGTNTNGQYTYRIDWGTASCPDSVFNVQVTIVSTPDLTTPAPVASCGPYILPAITGTNMSGNQRYYTGPGGTGSVVAVGTSITTSQTLYIYDGITGCSDEEQLQITITAPQNAGQDNAVSFCSPGALIDVSDYLDFTATAGGTWAETTTPASGTFNPGTAEWITAGIPTGSYTFTYTFAVNGPCPADQAQITIDLGTLSVDLGPDTSICQGATLTLNPGVYDSYFWNNGSTNQTRTVSLPGTYWVKVGQTGENLIVNGDFEQGNTGFTTQYTIGNSPNAFGPLFNEATYLILSSPNLGHTNFSIFADHTPGTGTLMMVVNGAGTPNRKVWCQTVTVDQNTEYQFSAWIASALSDPTVANLQFSINGTNLGGIFSPSTTGGIWEKKDEMWNSGMQSSAEICIVNQNTSTGGNDFVLDDIKFAPICYATDTIVVGNNPKPVVTITPNDTICAGEIGTLTASSTTPNLTYTWNPGSINGATINVSPATTTTYTVTGTSPFGCVSNAVNRQIVVHATPIASIAINGPNPVCNGTQTILNGSSNIGGVTYDWSTGEDDQTITVTATGPSTSYTLTVETGNGCSDDTTITITVIPDLVVDITGVSSFCEGDNTTLTVTGNLPGMDFSWSPGGATTNQITVNQSGWVYAFGDFQQCDQAKDSILITVNPNPTVTVPEDMSVCPGETVVATVSSDQPGSTFIWQPGGLTGSTNTITSNGTTTYTVVAQNGNCISEPQQFTINANAACYLTVPNVFTPNGDNNNDFFQLVNSAGLNSLECIIINRWGETVVTFDTPNFKWDGKDSAGNEVTEGVYFYKITAVTKADQELQEVGNVTVVRK